MQMQPASTTTISSFFLGETQPALMSTNSPQKGAGNSLHPQSLAFFWGWNSNSEEWLREQEKYEGKASIITKMICEAILSSVNNYDMMIMVSS